MSLGLSLGLSSGRRSLRRAVPAALIAVLVCGCGTLDPAPPDAGTATGQAATATARDAPEAAPPLRVTVQQGRLAATRGQIQFGLSTVDDASVDITTLQLDDPRFATVPPTSRATTVDRRLDIAVDIGDAICEGAPTGPPRAVIGLASRREPSSFPVTSEGDAVLAKLHDTACARQRALDGADIAFGPEWRSTGPATAEGTITITRAASRGVIELTQAQGTVIFTLRVLTDPVTTPGGGGTASVARLEQGEPGTEVPVEISAARCDAHALAESKKTFVFPMWLRVDDADPVFVTLEPRDRTRAVFEELMDVGCHR